MVVTVKSTVFWDRTPTGRYKLMSQHYIPTPKTVSSCERDCYCQQLQTLYITRQFIVDCVYMLCMNDNYNHRHGNAVNKFLSTCVEYNGKFPVYHYSGFICCSGVTFQRWHINQKLHTGYINEGGSKNERDLFLTYIDIIYFDINGMIYCLLK
jgi:hypothetical protein